LKRLGLRPTILLALNQSRERDGLTVSYTSFLFHHRMIFACFVSFKETEGKQAEDSMMKAIRFLYELVSISRSDVAIR